jgi:hypothetical protein
MPAGWEGAKSSTPSRYTYEKLAVEFLMGREYICPDTWLRVHRQWTFKQVNNPPASGAIYSTSRVLGIGIVSHVYWHPEKGYLTFAPLTNNKQHRMVKRAVLRVWQLEDSEPIVDGQDTWYSASVDDVDIYAVGPLALLALRAKYV